MDYQEYIDVLAVCCRQVFEDMTTTKVSDVTVKADARANPEYAFAQVITYEHLEKHVAGEFVLGFPSESMAIAVASAISESIGLGEVTEFGVDAEETLSEFMNTVVGRALSKWDSLGLPARFSPPRTLERGETQVDRAAHTKAYMVILTLEVSHVEFHVTFTKSMADPLCGRRVLVTDDSKIIRKLLATALEDVGMEVHTAINGREAVEKFQEVSPDLIIMDVVMPEMTGLEAAKAIREMDDTAKVLMLTSTSRRDEITTAKDIGAINYLLKPVKIPLLMEALRKALK